MSPLKKKYLISLTLSELIDVFDFAKNLFINIQINAESIIENLEDVKNNILRENKESVIIDYGGPNIGKPLHVGHLKAIKYWKKYLLNQ